VHDYYFSSPLYFWKEREFYPDWIQRLCYATMVRALEPRAYRRARFLIMNSEATRQRITTAYSLAEAKCKTIYIGLRFDSAEKSSRARRDAILFVGGNPYRKGLPRLIQAVHELRKRWPSLELWVVGTSLPRSLGEAGERLVAEHALKVYPVLTVESLGGLYRTARVFALPAFTEAFGLVFLEAMAYDCPVIGPADGGAQEIIIHGKTGFLVPGKRDDLLLLRLSQYLSDEALCHQFAGAARKRLALFSPVTTARDTLACYETVVS
jgi:spore coat protein SA